MHMKVKQCFAIIPLFVLGLSSCRSYISITGDDGQSNYQLRFIKQPQHTEVGKGFENIIQVGVFDQHEHIVAQGSMSQKLISIELLANARLSGTTQLQALEGIATFGDLRIDEPGTYQLQATDASGISVVSNTFEIRLNEEAKDQSPSSAGDPLVITSLTGPIFLGSTADTGLFKIKVSNISGLPVTNLQQTHSSLSVPWSRVHHGGSNRCLSVLPPHKDCEIHLLYSPQSAGRHELAYQLSFEFQGQHKIETHQITGFTEVTSLDISPSSVEAKSGRTTPLRCIVIFSDFSTVDATSACSWQSSDPSRASVDAQGKATWISNGSVDISATINSITTTLSTTITTPIFTTVWKTDNAGVSAADQITLPLVETGVYNFTVDWGDSTSHSITTWNDPNITHTYPAPGLYTVKITGIFEGFRFNFTGDRLKLLEVSEWGALTIGVHDAAFAGAANLVVTASDLLDLSGTTSLWRMFHSCHSLQQIPSIVEWDTSRIENWQEMFRGAVQFNQNIGMLDVSGGKNFFAMFHTNSVFNQDISAWDMSKAENLGFMFRGAIIFNQPIGSWDTTSVTNMNQTFYQAQAFNQPLSDWNTSKVTNMNLMFYNSAFNQDIGNWDVSSVTDMNRMFHNASFNQDISQWNTSSVLNMGQMFYNSGFNRDISAWNTSKVTTMHQMFRGNTSFNHSLNGWDLSSVTTLSGMFYGANQFNSDLSAWNTSNVTNMAEMFRGASSFNQDLSGWNTGNVTTMSGMFYGATQFNGNIGNWNTGNVTSTANMFYNATHFNQDISQWNTAKLEDASQMFFQANAFNQDLSSWNISSLSNMSGMFRNAASFNQYLDTWDISQVSNLSLAFSSLVNTGLTTERYDAILISWSKLGVLPLLAFGATNKRYSGGTALAARNVLTGTHGWTITDQGKSTVWPESGMFAALSNATPTSFTLNWTAGSDVQTTVANLQYYVCSGASILAIDTVRECLAGTMEMDWTTNITTLNLTDKTENTTYYYNVIVRDADHNMSIYNGLSHTTGCAKIDAELPPACVVDSAGKELMPIFYSDGDGEKWVAFEALTNGYLYVNEAADFEVEYYGGGGAGGNSLSNGASAGGGGAGERKAYTVSLSAGSYDFTIGDGGAGSHTLQGPGADGGSTIFMGIAAMGGGGGGIFATTRDGGSGGGAGASDGNNAVLGGQGISGGGFDGGQGQYGGVNFHGAGGGGGAGGPGQNGFGVFNGASGGGDGGVGFLSTITGTPKWYGGGGGGSTRNGTQGLGGLGGGGNGRVHHLGLPPTSGLPNTGSGGGGNNTGSFSGQSHGGSGVFLVRFR
jgi:surface protein